MHSKWTLWALFIPTRPVHATMQPNATLPEQRPPGDARDTHRLATRPTPPRGKDPAPKPKVEFRTVRARLARRAAAQTDRHPEAHSQASSCTDSPAPPRGAGVASPPRRRPAPSAAGYLKENRPPAPASTRCASASRRLCASAGGPCSGLAASAAATCALRACIAGAHQQMGDPVGRLATDQVHASSLHSAAEEGHPNIGAAPLNRIGCTWSYLARGIGHLAATQRILSETRPLLKPIGCNLSCLAAE
jgi:hypothetical protein